MSKIKKVFSDRIEQETFEMLVEAGLPTWEAEREVLLLREPLPMDDSLYGDL